MIKNRESTSEGEEYIRERYQELTHNKEGDIDQRARIYNHIGRYFVDQFSTKERGRNPNILSKRELWNSKEL